MFQPNLKQKVLILGAGPAGLACAYGLKEKGYKITILEKDKQVGGFAQTLEFKEGDILFKTDIGPHRFHTKNKKILDLTRDLLKDDLITVLRQTRQYIRGKLYNYPINAWQVLRHIGIVKSFKIIFSYLRSLINYKILKRPIISFYDYILANFGQELGNFNMLNYSEKIWGLSCQKLHPNWAQQRIKGLNFLSAAKNALLKTNGVKTLIESFYYPREGTGQLYKKMAEKIIESGGKIYLQSQPLKIYHDNHKINKIEVANQGQKQEFEPDYLFTSIPIDQLVSLLDPQPPQEIFQAINNLQWRDQLYLFIIIDKDKVGDDQWLYFPDSEIRFARISEMKNFSSQMSPPTQTSLLIEFFTNQNDDLWQMPAEKIFDYTVEQLSKLKFLDKSEVVNYHLFRKNKAYPIYTLDYPANLAIINKYLSRFNNLNCIGRPGCFQYTNQDESINMGLEASQKLGD